MKLQASILTGATLLLVGCNHNDTNSPTLAERTDHFKQNVREGFRPSEHSSLDESANDTYQPSNPGYRSTSRDTYNSTNRDTYNRNDSRYDNTRDPNPSYRTTDTPTRP